jgi:hypothetical protein
LFDALVLAPNDGLDGVNGPTSHGSIGRTDDEHDGEDDDGVFPFLQAAGKLDIGKSGLIFSVLASAFS